MLVFLTIVLLALDVGLGHLRSRFNPVWLGPLAMAGFVFALFLGVQKMMASEATFTIHVPSPPQIVASLGLVFTYIIGRKAFDLFCLATGRTRHPIYSFILDRINEKTYRSRRNP